MDLKDTVLRALNELVKKPEKFNLAQALRIIILTNGKNYAECLQYLKHK